MPHGIKHSREEIISGIQQAIQEGADLRTSQVQKSRYRWAYRSFPNYFDSWPQALEAAGTSYQEVKSRAEAPRKDARKQKWIEELKQAYQAGVDLSASSLQKDDEHRHLYERGKSFFPGRLYWETALRAAELPVEEIIKQQEWTRGKVILKLKERQAAGLPMNQEAVGNSLSKAAIRRFGNYDSALEAIGLDPKTVRKAREAYSTLEIISAIQQAATRGDNLNIMAARKSKRLSGYFNAAEKHIEGGWYEAIRQAGVDDRKYRKRARQGSWDREKVIAAIKKIAHQGGPLHPSGVDSKLYKAATNYCFSWENAVRAAGVDYSKVVKKKLTKVFSKQELTRFIQCLHRWEVPINMAAMQNGEEIERKIYQQSIRKDRFGGWRKAVQSAGIDYSQVRERREPYSFRELSARVRELQAEGQDLSPKKIPLNPELKRIHHAVTRKGISWSRFLTKIGIDAASYCQLRRDWGEAGQGILVHLRENFPSGIVTGASNDKGFAAIVRAHYGTIREAVRAAGLVYSRYGGVSRAMLQDASIRNALLVENRTFFQELVDNFLRGKAKFVSPKEREGLVTRLGERFLETLPSKHCSQDAREFAKPLLLKSLEENQ